MSEGNRRGIWLMIATVFAFACQDGFSRHLAGTYNTLMVVMLRYWVFAAFVVVLALRARAELGNDHVDGLNTGLDETAERQHKGEREDRA